uniref:Fibronectin type-III domain-containing protein n=1 Tax=Adineta vaga TaxID=104782 RepID=B3G4K7_ADIVA|nr:unknown [Adineta vaga]
MLNKLTPATFYKFLNKYNSMLVLFFSEFSETIRFSTLGTIPPEPDPPMLLDKGIKTLTLNWTSRPSDETFTLQMNDESNYFRNKYTGSLLTYTVTDLYRNTEYKFRLSAHNQEGQSNYSQIATYKTLPDRPDPPAKPRIKGHIQATQCRIVWGKTFLFFNLKNQKVRKNEKLNDSIYLWYFLGFHVIYNGLDTEYLLEQLIPGHLYSLRLSCSSIGGHSEPSDITQIKTPAVAPTSCHPPKISGKPKANSLHLRWAYPDYDGGSPVIEFEVQVINSDNSSRIVYRGHNLDCVVAGLLPGRPYLFQVRAFNRAGVCHSNRKRNENKLFHMIFIGWSMAPRNISVECRTANSAYISWEEGVNNGGTITEYRLEWSRKENDSFMQLYCGTNCFYEVKGLIPVTHYFFRVQAVNTAGPGPYSMLVSCVTPATPPSIVTSVKVVPKSTAMSITWKVPSNNGSPITGYYIDIGEKELIFASPDLTEYIIDEVLPDTAYRIRIRAVNTIGQGPYSSTVKCQTRSLPPDAPQLECAAATYNSLKLKWNPIKCTSSINTNNPDQTSSSTRMITYLIEMENKDGTFNCIYTGNTASHKINKLQENTSYHFRICAKNDAGAGPWSEIFTCSTTKAPPNALKAPNITEITSTSCVFNWQAHKPLGKDTISYVLQLQIYRKETDYTELYHGELTSYRATNLESGVDYRARVCAIRTTNEGLALNSPFSPATHFVLPRPEDLAAALTASKALDNRLLKSDINDRQSSLINRIRLVTSQKLKSMKLFESRTLTDQQWAFVISVGFALLAIFIAIFANVVYSKYNNDSSISKENQNKPFLYLYLYTYIYIRFFPYDRVDFFSSVLFYLLSFALLNVKNKSKKKTSHYLNLFFIIIIIDDYMHNLNIHMNVFFVSLLFSFCAYARSHCGSNFIFIVVFPYSFFFSLFLLLCFALLFNVVKCM